jgi:GNAT superfamily N-acetyltransferase
VPGPVRVERLEGERLRRLLPDLARLRIEVFRAYPYLYEGDQAYEERYLRTYAEAEDSVIVGAFDGDRVVGAATALPLRHEPDDLTRPFAERGYAVDEVFYFGESVLLDAYRGRGVGVAFFREREAAALAHPGIRWAAFCAVIRPDDHPRRPAGHVPLDAFWRKRGYERVEGMVGRIAWRDLDEAEETPKPMQFWIRRLR